MVILKGGMLITSLVGLHSRTTMDMNAALRGYPLSEGAIRATFTAICPIPLDDEVTFELGHIGSNREEDKYGGYRVSLTTRLESIHTPLKIGITSGDMITS